MGYPVDAAAKRVTPPTQCYQRRRPEQTLWYRTVQMHFETWQELTNGPGDESIPAYIEQAFRRYLDCGKNQTLFFTFASSTACGRGLR
jgi:hypothetical protein